MILPPRTPRSILCALCTVFAQPVSGYGYTISPPIEKGETPAVAGAPLRKEEAAIMEQTAKLYTERIYVEGHDPDRRMPPPRSVEQKFSDALNQGNPEVPGGTLRHGVFYDGLFYWGSDPLSFIYYNVRNRMIE